MREFIICSIYSEIIQKFINWLICMSVYSDQGEFAKLFCQFTDFYLPPAINFNQ